MPAFSGPQQKGAAATRRRTKREQAEARNALTPIERTRKYRQATS